MENIQTTQTQKRQKTGGRQKGTPNKTTASVKLFIKNHLLAPENVEAYQQAFLSAKPEALIAHYEKMIRYICAPQSEKTNGGEWLPDDKMDLEWPADFGRRQDAIHEKLVAQDDALHEKKLKAAEMAYEMDFYRQKFYEMGVQLKDVISNTDFFRELIIRYGADNFWKALNDFDSHLIAKCLELQGIVPPKPIRIADTTIYPPEDTTATEESETPEDTTAEETIDEENDAAPSDPSELSDPSDSSEESKESEESMLNAVSVSQTVNLAPSPDPVPSHPSPSTCSNCGIESNLGMPRLPNRKANKVQSNSKVQISNLKVQSNQPFYLGALNRRHR